MHCVQNLFFLMHNHKIMTQIVPPKCHTQNGNKAHTMHSSFKMHATTRDRSLSVQNARNRESKSRIPGKQ